MRTTVLSSDVPGFPKRKGKVRDVYDLGENLVLVATDRISAYDWVLPTGIPDKGKVLTEMSVFWFDFLRIPHHFLSTNLAEMGPEFESRSDTLKGRSCLVRKTHVVPIECVVRGYLAGSGWREYSKTGTIAGMPLPKGLRQAEKLPEPIFTPATKEEEGHDQNISFDEMCERIGRVLAEELRQRSLEVYAKGAKHAEERGILLADTKFEWGQTDEGDILLIDEVLTPDSSRFWPANEYELGGSPPSFDKQFVRDWLDGSGWDKKTPPAPELPEAIVEKTRQKYIDALSLLTETSDAL